MLQGGPDAAWVEDLDITCQLPCPDLISQRRPQDTVDHHHERRSARFTALRVLLPQRVKTLQSRFDVRRHDCLAARFDLDVGSPCRGDLLDILITLDRKRYRARLSRI